MNLNGYVDELGQARISVTIRGFRSAIRLDVAIDTAFSGDICLPIHLATQLGLELITTQHFELADGAIKEELVFLGFVHKPASGVGELTLSEEKPVAIVLTDSPDALLGIGSLSEAKLHIDFIAKTVEIY